RSVGMTPWQFFTQVRLEAVREAMSDGVPMNQAAIQCGFSDQAHLTRVFKQKFGIPPSTYVKRLARSRRS
ncbi:MAG: helix-turn-helix domain-containing protein, partial [Novosphingobium sp.]